VSSRFGEAYRHWLPAVHAGAHGNADLSAHFFRRASSLIGRNGTVGLIATNTIGQGDTRETGLGPLVNMGLTIYSAAPNMPWPGAAAVTVSVVHLAKGVPAVNVERSLDGRCCDHVNSSLQEGSERQQATPLSSNMGTSYLGSKVYGQGFTLTPAERTQLIGSDRRNTTRIFRYIGGEDVNTSPTLDTDRYVISFGTMTLDEASAWPDLLAIVRAKVKPERDRLREDTGPGQHGKKYWWQFQHPRAPLYEAISPFKRCLVSSQVTKHLCFSFQPTDRIFSHKLYVFPLDHYTAFAVLQSRIHERWARLLSSTLKTDLNYSASDCFDTFPFPKPDPRSDILALEQAGESLYRARARYMVDTDQGLTKTYNALKDPQQTDSRILHLRSLHEAMDRAVLDAYGWSDLTVPPFCPSSDSDDAALKRFKAQVIERLSALNAERAAEEARLGLGPKPRKGRTKREAAPPPEAPQRASLKPLRKASSSAQRRPTSHPPPPKRRAGTR